MLFGSASSRHNVRYRNEGEVHRRRSHYKGTGRVDTVVLCQHFYLSEGFGDNSHAILGRFALGLPLLVVRHVKADQRFRNDAVARKQSVQGYIPHITEDHLQLLMTP